MKKSDVGLIGLGVMGASLALNLEDKGFSVSVYNRPHSKKDSVVKKFLDTRAKGKNFFGTEDIAEFVKSLARPRIVILMVKAGEAVDEIVNQLLPHLAKGDIVIDGGNSDFHDTQRRVSELSKSGILFVGCGISGGEEGALKGPSIMPGGNPEAWPKIKKVLKAIAARAPDGDPCCRWIGEGRNADYRGNIFHTQKLQPSRQRHNLGNFLQLESRRFEGIPH